MGGGLPGRKKGISTFLVVVQALVFLACGMAINLLWVTPHAEEHAGRLSTKEVQIKASAKHAATIADPPRLRPEAPHEAPSAPSSSLAAAAAAAKEPKVDPIAAAIAAGTTRKRSLGENLESG